MMSKYFFGGVSNKEILWCNDEGIYQTFFPDRYGLTTQIIYGTMK